MSKLKQKERFDNKQYLGNTHTHTQTLDQNRGTKYLTKPLLIRFLVVLGSIWWQSRATAVSRAGLGMTTSALQATAHRADLLSNDRMILFGSELRSARRVFQAHCCQWNVHLNFTLVVSCSSVCGCWGAAPCRDKKVDENGALPW